MPERRSLVLVAAAAVMAAAACSVSGVDNPLGSGAASTPTPRLETPTPLPEPSLLVVCLAAEPDTFYLYGNPNASARTLFPLLYDGPFDLRRYRVEPVILDALPSVDAGTLRLQPVSIVSGDLYLNPETGLAEPLRPGKSYLPSGCTAPSCQKLYQGGGATLDQVVADFRLMDGLVWSDGEPLTASDSVYSFRLDADPDTPTLKDQVHRTSTYQAIDDHTVRWTGIPGYFDPEVSTNFWSPLPEHLLRGVPAAELPGLEEAARAPIGWGPYRLDGWTPGASIEFVPNPLFRGEPPGFERVLVRFLEAGGDGALQQIITGECDVLEESLVDLADSDSMESLASQGRLQWLSTPGPLIERLDFSMRPAEDRRTILADAEMRRALAACIDRQALIDIGLSGLSPVPQSALSADHPLAQAGSNYPSFNPALGSAALDDLGWVDADGDPATPRVAQGAAGMTPGTPLSLELTGVKDPLVVRLAESIRDDLGACGVEVTLDMVPAGTLFEPWPDGPVFGRDFDLVLWPWLQWLSPGCESFASAEIASASRPEGYNASGFSDPTYDAACSQLGFGPLAGEAYARSLETTQAILVESLPSLPLFQWPRMLVTAPGFCGPALDATVDSLLWNVEVWRAGPDCAGAP